LDQIFFEPTSGKQIWVNSPHTSPIKIMVANPGSYSTVYDSSKNHKAWMRIFDNRAYIWNIDASELTTVRMSYIEVRTITDYLQVTGETVANGAALAQKASTPTANFFQISGTGGAETFTDDLNGNLVGSGGGKGTINYTSGVISFSPIAGPVGNLTSVSYRYSDELSTWTPSGGSLSGGIQGFVVPAARVATQPNVFQQSHGGNVKSIVALNNNKFCGHDRALWDIITSSDDLTFNNNIFRNSIGIPSLRGMFSSPEGIYTVDLNDKSNPKFVIVSYSGRTTDIKPVVISPNLDLTKYSFDQLAVFPFNDYMCYSLRTSDSTFNNRTFVYHRVYKTWDILDYAISCADIYNNLLIGGHSISNNVFNYFSGNDADGDVITNFWKSGISRLGYITARGTVRIIFGQKKVKRIFIEGDIGPNQVGHLFISLDRGPLVEVLDEAGGAIVRGDGSYVDKSQRVTLGSVTLGDKVLGGGGDGIEAYHYERYVKFPQGKFAEIEIMLQVDNVGYMSVTKLDFWDIRVLQDKASKKYRVF
jgi:hypothetical protein